MTRPTRSRTRAPLALAPLLALLLVAAACGSGDSGTATEGGTTAPATGSPPGDGCVAAATEVVDAARAPLELKAPPSPLDATALAGKQVWLVNTVNNQLTTVVGDGFTDGAAALGMQAMVIDGKGEANTWNQAMNQAVSQGVDGIAILGIDSQLISGPLEAAEAAGIPVVDIFNGRPDDPPGDGIVAHVTPDFTVSGEVMAEWMLADSGCDATAVLFGAEVLKLHVEIMDAIEATFEGRCPGCTVVRENVDLANMANDLGSKVPNVLRREGDVDYLVPVFDSAATFVIPAAQGAGFEGGVLSHDGVPANLELVAAGDQAFDGSFPPNEWIGWALVDQLARAVLGLPVVDWTIPVQVFDQTNIGSGDDLFPAYEGFQDAFTKAWGS